MEQHARAESLTSQRGAAGSLATFQTGACAWLDSEVDIEVLAAGRAFDAAGAASGLSAKSAAGTEGRTPVLFLGSSRAARSQAKALMDALPRALFLPWWEAFTPGRTLLEELDTIRGKVDGALLLFSPEHKAIIRGKTVAIPNLNVLYEFAYFYGHFGKQRVCMVKYGDFYLPSDFGGYIYIWGSDSFRRGRALKVRQRTIDDFARWRAFLWP